MNVGNFYFKNFGYFIQMIADHKMYWKKATVKTIFQKPNKLFTAKFAVSTMWKMLYLQYHIMCVTS